MSMEILERQKRGRRSWKNRMTARDESAQPSAFPKSQSVPEAAELQDNAAKKEEVKKAAAAIPEIFTPKDVIWLFDVYTTLISFLYSMALKTDMDAIEKELEFSQEQKELMAEPLARIFSKYAPPEWAGKTAEIQLVVMLGVWTSMSYKRAKNVAQVEKEKKRDAERTRPVQPIRQPQEVHVPA